MGDFSDYSALIDKYISGDLSEKDRIEFERELAGKADLQKMVEDTQLIKIGITAIEREKMLESVRKASIEFKSKRETKSRKLNFRSLSIAASLLILISISFTIYYTSQRSSYLSGFMPYTGYEALASRGETKSDTAPLNVLDNAWSLYNSGKFQESLQTISSVTPPEIFDAEFSFLKGLCLIEEKEYKAAIPYFESAASNPRFRYNDDAFMYLGLTYLQIGEKEKGKAVLEQIENPSEEVKKVLDKID